MNNTPNESSPALIRIATRGSQLALWQARHVQDLLQQLPTPIATEIVIISTSGDQRQQESLKEFAGRGAFTREVQHAVLECQADIAVHSLKDLPTAAVDGLKLGAVAARGPLFDWLVLPADPERLPAVNSLDDLPSGARIGTGSPRRQAQLLYAREDIVAADIRGNVETRLRKLDEGQFDAIVLAEAGMTRLGLADGRRTINLRPPLMLPAVGQGAVGIECRSDDQATSDALAQISCQQTTREVTAERALMAELSAGCHAPLGTYCQWNGEELRLQAVILSSDGKQRISAEASKSADEAVALGRHVAELLREQGAEPLLQC